MAVIRVATYQMRVGADIQANFHRIALGIETAAKRGARLLVLPECAISGYPPLHHARRADIDIPRIAEMNHEVSKLAAASGMWVVLGTILGSSGGLLNSALVISDSGEIVGRQDKLHLMPGDKDYFIPGWDIAPVEILGVTCGVLVCYDVRFPEAYRLLREQGAEVFVTILNACGGETWKLPVMEGTFRARASENSAFMVAVNAAGPLQMGVSRILNPLGLDLASANQDTEEIIYAEIDTSLAQSGCYYDRRTDLYTVDIVSRSENDAVL